jgi:group I intron endonuclease
MYMVRELPPSPGVYAIVNVATGERYIGGSTNIRSRWQTHLSHLRKNQSTHTKLQAAWNQWGENSFLVVVVEEVGNRDELIAREQHYLDTYQPEYNTRQSADNSIGIPHDEASRAKMSAALRGRTFTDEHRANLSAALSGRTYSDETLAKMRAAKAHISNETRARMSVAKKGKTPSRAAIAAAEKANRGKSRSPEVVEKIRAAQRERWARKKEELLANAKRDEQGKFTG